MRRTSRHVFGSVYIMVWLKFRRILGSGLLDIPPQAAKYDWHIWLNLLYVNRSTHP